jgi:hypothetical protein
MEAKRSLPHSQQPAARPRQLWRFHNMVIFCGEELLVVRPTTKLEDHPLLAVCDCLFNLFSATLHVGGCSSICNLRTQHAVVTGTHLSQPEDAPCRGDRDPLIHEQWILTYSILMLFSLLAFISESSIYTRLVTLLYRFWNHDVITVARSNIIVYLIAHISHTSLQME